MEVSIIENQACCLWSNLRNLYGHGVDIVITPLGPGGRKIECLLL